MEAVWGGAYPLCPDLPEFKEFFPRNDQEIPVFFNSLLSDNNHLFAQYVQMVEIVKEKYLVSGLEQKRFELLDKMMQS